MEKTWWIREGVLLAGCFPGDRDKDKARNKLQRLLDANIRVFISLQEPDERSPQGPFVPYMPMLEQLAQEAGIEVGFVNFPIRDNGTPSTELMADILATIRDAHMSGRCVYLHCWGGHGRTGTLIACLIAFVEKKNEKEAIKAVRERYCKLAVESKSQEDFVRRFIEEVIP